MGTYPALGREHEGDVRVVGGPIDPVHERRPGCAAGSVGAVTRRAEPIECFTAGSSLITQRWHCDGHRHGRTITPLADTPGNRAR